MGAFAWLSSLRHSMDDKHNESFAMTFDIHIINSANLGLLDVVAPDVFDTPIQPQLLAAFCDQPSHFMAVAEVHQLVVGQIRAILHLNPDEPPTLYIDNLGVTPNQKRKGIARALMNTAWNWGRAQGAKSFWVATEWQNDEAKAFYAAFALKEQKIAYFEGKL